MELALAGVMTVLRRPPGWEEAKRALAEASFMDSLLQYDKEALSNALLKKLARFTSDPQFTAEVGAHNVHMTFLLPKGACPYMPRQRC